MTADNDTISADTIARLREAATKATPGPWVRGSWNGRCHIPEHGQRHPGPPDCVYDYELDPEADCVSLGDVGWDDYGTVLSGDNAAHIAAADPTTVLALISELLLARAVVETGRVMMSKHSHWCGFNADAPGDPSLHRWQDSLLAYDAEVGKP